MKPLPVIGELLQDKKADICTVHLALAPQIRPAQASIAQYTP